jgi:cytochrome b6-f complex iron-sulfur subunit
MENQSRSNRREFLTKSISVLGFGIIAGTIPTLFSSCNSSPTASSNPVATEVIISNYPSLLNNNGYVKISISGRNNNKPIIIIRKTETEFTVLSAVCTHQGCTVNDPNISGKSITCPCHGSKFNLTGGVMSGPANGALTSFASTFNSTTNVLSFSA